MRIAIKLIPKASKSGIQGWSCNPDGGHVLRCSVTAVPEKGKANKALIALLAKELGIAKSSITLIRGETDRNKILDIDMDAAGIYAAIGVPPSAS